DADYAAAVGECCLDPGLPDPLCESAGGASCDPGSDSDCACTTSASVTDGCANPGPLMVNSEAQVDVYLIDLVRAEIEARRADIEVQRALGQVASLRNRAVRLMAQQDETEQHLINVEAARNDPNIRIFANADVLAAARTSHDGLVDAFRATRMFEYYTAQSYAKKADLVRVRMAGRGEDNLEDYLLDLQRDFNDFEQTYGSPSLRVAMVSLRDDIFRIPMIDDEGRALRPEDRTNMLRESLTSPKLIDEHGYIRIPFSTALAMT